MDTIIWEKTADDNNTIEDIDKKTGERFIICSSNLYDGSVELAQQVGIELEDG